MKYGPCHCRICGRSIDRNTEIEGVDWMERSKGWIYCVSCYNDWQTKKDDIHTNNIDEDLWKDATYQYLHKDLRIPIDWGKFDSQWKSLKKKGRTPKGIYFCVRYFYEIEKGDTSKAKGGIGIVDYVYQTSCSYWAEREYRSHGILNLIEEQVKERAAREKITIKRDKKKKKKNLMDEVEAINDYDSR